MKYTLYFIDNFLNYILNLMILVEKTCFFVCPRTKNYTPARLSVKGQALRVGEHILPRLRSVRYPSPTPWPSARRLFCFNCRGQTRSKQKM